MDFHKKRRVGKKAMSSSRASNCSSGRESVITTNTVILDDFHDHHSSQKSIASNLALEEIEPYVRRQRCNSASEKSAERAKKRVGNLTEEDQNILRMCINSRERRRMHNLNEALDGLRRVIPRSDNPNQRKISKIATINLATKWICQLTSELEHLKKRNAISSIDDSASSKLFPVVTTPAAENITIELPQHQGNQRTASKTTNIVTENKRQRKRKQQTSMNNDNDNIAGMTQQQINAHNQQFGRMQQHPFISPFFIQQTATAGVAAANLSSGSTAVYSAHHQQIANNNNVSFWKNISSKHFAQSSNNSNEWNATTISPAMLHLRQLALISAAAANMINAVASSKRSNSNAASMETLAHHEILHADSSVTLSPRILPQSCDDSVAVKSVDEDVTEPIAVSRHPPHSSCLCVSCLLSSSSTGDDAVSPAEEHNPVFPTEYPICISDEKRKT